MQGGNGSDFTDASFVFPGDSSPFQALLRALEDCQIFVTDQNGLIISWLTGEVPALGDSQDEDPDQELQDEELQNAATIADQAPNPIGFHFSILFTGRDRDREWPARMLQWASSSAMKVKDEGWRLGRDERRYWAEHIITLVEPDHPEAGFVHVLYNADRRLSAERAVREADRRILEYQHVARLGSFEYDPSTSRYLVTPEILRIFELPVPPTDTADFVPVPAETLTALIHSEDRMRMVMISTSMEPSKYKLRMAKDARLILVRSIPVKDRQGAVLRWIGTMQDITDFARQI
jgi:PAS domain-containing protein